MQLYNTLCSCAGLRIACGRMGSLFQSQHLAILKTGLLLQSGIKASLSGPWLSWKDEIHNLCTHDLVYILQNEKPQEREEINTQEKDDRAESFHLQRRPNEGQHAKELNIQEQQEAGEDDEQHVDQVEEERKKELEEEEMEQAGQPEHLEEEQDQVPEEHEWKKQEQKEEETNMLGDHVHSEVWSSWITLAV